MITALIIGGAVVYVVGSYVIVARWLTDNPGPAGLGWLVLPIAPLIIPMVGWQFFKAFMRRIFS